MTDQGRIDELNRESARLAAAIVFILQKEDAGYVSFLGCPYRKKLEEVLDGSSTALRDRLEPVVEAFSQLPVVHFEGTPHYIIPIETCDETLTRLRALVERKA